MTPVTVSFPTFRIWALIFSILVLSCGGITFTYATDEKPLVLYAAVDGNDGWTGHLESANSDKSDGPFATLQRARDEIRSVRSKGSFPAGGVLVVVHGGTYYLDAPLELTAEDSGTETARIAYTAYPGEEVRLSGGRPVSNFSSVTDPAVLERLDESARVRVQQADLKALGITNYGPPDGGGLEVFHEDTPMWISRWPNESFVKIPGLVEQDGHEIHGIPGSKTGKFFFEGDRPKRWIGEKDPWLHGYWFWDWSDQRQQIESIDLERKILTVKQPYHNYGYRKGQWYYAFNMLSEVDTPGEYYVDRENGILYLWPLSWISEGSLTVSLLENLVVMKDASYVTMSGFTLEAARGTAVRVEGGSENRIDHCILRNLGGQGAEVSGEGHGIVGCEIYRTGRGGVSISGGDRTTLRPGGVFVENCHIHDYGRVFRMYQAGVSLQGVGNRVANNLIHSAPHIGIIFGGNDHTIEYNEIHHVCFESNDAGAIYAGRNWTMRGNVIRYNYMHDVAGFENRGCVGVYLDDMFASAEIYGNIFHKVTSAAFIGGGRDCTVENNIFVDCKPALHVDARALNWAHYHADEWIAEATEKGTISGIAYRQEPYASRYPKLPTILDKEPKAPEGNIISHNICVGGKWDDIESIARPYLTLENNLLDTDPLFVDAAGLDFRLKEDSPAYNVGFKPIPIEKIGLFNGGMKGDTDLPVLLKDCLTSSGDASHQPMVSLGLARAARLQKDYTAANGFFRAAIETTKQSGAPYAYTIIERGNMLVESGQYEAARKVYDEVVADASVAPDRRSVAQLQIGRTYKIEGKNEEAIAAYRQVQEIPGIPPQHPWEAEECINQIEDAETGCPDGFPFRTRTQLAAYPIPGTKLYVSLTGSDRNTGTEEKPFQTIERALEEARRIKKDGVPKGGIGILLAGGTYSLKKGIKIGPEFTGTEESPLTLAAMPHQKVIFNAGAKIEGFAPVTDTGILSRLPEDSRGKVLQVNLKEHGITQYGELISRGFGVTNANNASLELFFNGKPMTPARWPNEGFVRTGQVIESGKTAEGKTGLFVFDNPRIERWSKAHDMMLYGYWYYDWADCMVGVAGIDFASKTIRTKQDTNYGYKEGQPFRVFNLLEEIDQPSEWYLDRGTGTLYFYPPEEPASATVELSILEEPLLKLEGVSHVMLTGLNFELGQGDGIIINGGEKCRIAGCTVRRMGGTGLTVNGGQDHLILACDIHTLGRGGITISGGDRLTLTPSGHVVENCEIFDFSRIDRTYTPALQMDGVGIRVAHNKIHDTPCHALRIEGNDHLVEFNEVFNVVRESDDQGGIDMFYNPTFRGNIFRYNYWHDIGSGRACGGAGIRLDDAISGTLIYGNVFARCSDGNFGGVQIHGGKDNWVENNLFIDCHFAISLSQWSDERWEEFLSGEQVKGFLDAVKINKPPYSTRYPDLARIHDAPYKNRIWRNLVINSDKFIVRERIVQDQLDNTLTRIDPGFIDMASDHYSWRDDAPGLNYSSFRPIPFKEIGLYSDSFRKSTP
jgi:tetratricopeptide (TPR) repeat protein